MEWSEDLGGIKLRISRDANSPEDIIVEFDVGDRDLLVKKPKLKIEFVTQRLKSKWQGLVLRGGNKDKKTAFNGELPIDTLRQTLELKNTPFFDFSGEEIESFCVAKLYHRGSPGEKRVPNPFPLPRAQIQGAEQITQPKDAFDRSANFARLPTKTKVKTRLIQLLMACAFIGVLFWGFSVEIWNWETSSRNTHPVIFWLLGLSLFPMLILFQGKLALYKYVSVDKSVTASMSPKPNDSYSLSEMVSGSAEVDIDNAIFRVVCCNRERYRYLHHSGNSSTWRDRFHDFNGLVLYEEHVARIPAGSSLSNYLPKTRDISFDQMFATLYPQAMISKHYGISVYWEVQIIHDELVDTEIPVAGVDRDWPFEFFFQEDKVES